MSTTDNVMSYSATSFRKQARGFSLVEVMVAMAISSILLAGVLTVVYSSKVTYNENERVGRLQESGRAAMEILLRDLRGAGFPGCAQPISGLLTVTNLIANNTDLLWDFDAPVSGFQSTGEDTWDPALDGALIPAATSGSDVLVVRGVRSGAPVFRVPGVLGPTDDIVVEKMSGEDLAMPTPMVVSDCGSTTIFLASGFAGSGTTATIARTTESTPANSDTDLQATFDDARVAPIVTMIYYIRDSEAGTGPALWRKVGNRDPEELIQGVENLQVRYGVDTNADALIDNYVEANEVADWSTVISVSLAMLVRSAQANSTQVDRSEYVLFDESPDGTLDEVKVGPFNDRFQRSLFTTTVTLRNRTT